ncbi:MAG: signal peptidase I [Akkermansia sp.]
MNLIKRIFFAILDTLFAWFTPTWRKEGHAVAAATSRYLHHFKHKIEQERYAELAEPLAELRQALNRWDAEHTKRLTQVLTMRGEGRLGFKRSVVAEMVESIFVIMVVFLGIRSYYAQPFRIPTGSMQPSLNGIIVHPIDEVPGLAERMVNMVCKGSSYVDIVADNRKTIVGMKSQPKYLLLMETVIQFDDGSTETVPSAPGAVMEYLREVGKYRVGPFGVSYGTFEAGETIIRARADAGDMIIVNRMAYHFRKPERGETFVFDTRGINTKGGSSAMSDQSAGTHYIKRLAALPGDQICLQTPQLFINGEVAKEATFQRVMNRQSPYNEMGYNGLLKKSQPLAYLPAGETRTLANPKTPANMREYVALGDNTINSLDSRYWGTVKQFNVVGPAAFTLWPFTSHWGIIP